MANGFVLVGALLWGTFASLPGNAELAPQGLGPLLAAADVVAVVKIDVAGRPGELAQTRVLNPVRGHVQKGDRLLFRYPQPNIEDEAAYVPPNKGTVLLAFLSKGEDGVYVPASSIVHTRRLSDGGVTVPKIAYAASMGAVSLKPLSEDQAAITAQLVIRLSTWDQMAEAERSQTIQTALRGPLVCRRLALDWSVLDGKYGFDASRGITDEIAEGLIDCLASPDSGIKRTALLALGTAINKRGDLVAYLVEALDSPDTQGIAVSRLDGTRGKGPGPQLSSTASTADKARVLKTWWNEVGVKRPEFRKFISHRR